MLLKRLELQGFKSFADKTILEFVEGSTAVVGPNGSGKSNISDAIRWVIGEMSAKSLRGSNMQDVIFAGTETRKPVNFAEVSLVLDNSSHLFDINYDEVVVTRRLFRSGESVYQINRSNCRLKDIHELFMDTGLGRDGYSIIGQGNVSQILSTKAEDRRSLFEEAAGISKYKYRREEAERKLKGVEENLVRITFSIFAIAFLIGAHVTSVGMAMLFSGVFGIGIGIIMPVKNIMILPLSPKNIRGAFISISNLINECGQALGQILFGFLFVKYNLSGVFYGAALISAVIVFLAVVFLRKAEK